MEILPAIDLLEGRCVRLMQGRYDRVIEYASDPVDVAKRFLDAGARWLHVVDLDGARDGCIANLDALESIATTGAQIHFGGGVRGDAAIDAALAAGATRVIVGTRALEDTAWFREVVHAEKHRERICLGLDARLGVLAVDGWTRETTRTAMDVVDEFGAWPLAGIVYTDIGRDGMLLGPNIKAIRNLAANAELPVFACGGISDIDDVRRLHDFDLAGVVIGRAIYERSIDLAEAVALSRDS